MTEQEFQKIKDRDEACKAGRRIRDAGQFAERDRSVLIAEVERLRVCEIFSDIDRSLSYENLELQAEVERLKAENAKLLEQALNMASAMMEAEND